jgi:G:T-mismatch repair DNA endonuclease (very short patch repair protein)
MSLSQEFLEIGLSLQSLYRGGIHIVIDGQRLALFVLFGCFFKNHFHCLVLYLKSPPFMGLGEK